MRIHGSMATVRSFFFDLRVVDRYHMPKNRHFFELKRQLTTAKREKIGTRVRSVRKIYPFLSVGLGTILYPLYLKQNNNLPVFSIRNGAVDLLLR